MSVSEVVNSTKLIAFSNDFLDKKRPYLLYYPHTLLTKLTGADVYGQAFKGFNLLSNTLADQFPEIEKHLSELDILNDSNLRFREKVQYLDDFLLGARYFEDFSKTVSIMPIDFHSLSDISTLGYFFLETNQVDLTNVPLSVLKKMPDTQKEGRAFLGFQFLRDRVESLSPIVQKHLANIGSVPHLTEAEKFKSEVKSLYYLTRFWSTHTLQR